MPEQRETQEIEAGPVEDPAQRVTEVAQRLGLSAQAMNERHWHLRRTAQVGTLEVTFEPISGRWIVEVRANRKGAWTSEGLAQVARELALHAERGG